MASIGKKDGGDFVLESRHLVGLFLLLVVIFGVVFTLGYLLGRGQFDNKLSAAVTRPAGAAPANSKPATKPSSENTEPKTASPSWEFYHSAEPKTEEDHLQPEPKKKISPPVPVAAKVVKPVAKPLPKVPPLNAPLIPSGSIMLQVAAVVSQGDALALAQALQQKKFAAFVINPSTDKYYRVQIGPYANSQAAIAAQRDLEAKGFKSIVKR